MSNPKPFKSGFIAVVGRPNAGKSTLVNVLVGAKVSIVTRAPQTTRNRILGIVNRPDAQIVLMDTPGIHRPLYRLNEQMMGFVRQALEGRDLVLFIVDVTEKFGKGDQFAIDLLKEYKARAILLLNKIDRIKKPALLPLMAHYSTLYPFDEIIPVSALHASGLEEVVDAVMARLPEGPQYFPSDIYTDQPERFLASEIIREKVIESTRQELPYVTTVVVEQFQEGKELTRIHATVIVDKESQKAIVIGAGGSRIKQIGTDARRELEKIFPPKVYLQLYAKAEPDWRNRQGIVSAIDYSGNG